MTTNSAASLRVISVLKKIMPVSAAIRRVISSEDFNQETREREDKMKEQSRKEKLFQIEQELKKMLDIQKGLQTRTLEGAVGGIGSVRPRVLTLGAAVRHGSAGWLSGVDDCLLPAR